MIEDCPFKNRELIVNLFLKDLGCRTGGSYSCLNGGYCLDDGNCECKHGYSGSKCDNCEH